MQPGDKVFVKVFRSKWFDERRQGPFEVVCCSGTAVQVKGSPTWFHLSHCVKAQTTENPRGQAHPSLDPIENEAEVQNDPEGLQQVEEVDDTVVRPSVDVGSDISG